MQALDKGKALLDWRFSPQFTCCTSTKVQILTLEELLLQELDKGKALLEGCVKSAEEAATNLQGENMRQYLYFCTSKASKLSTLKLKRRLGSFKARI